MRLRSIFAAGLYLSLIPLVGATGHLDGADGGGAVCRGRGATLSTTSEAQAYARATSRRLRFAPHDSSGATLSGPVDRR